MPGKQEPSEGVENSRALLHMHEHTHTYSSRRTVNECPSEILLTPREEVEAKSNVPSSAFSAVRSQI